MGKRIMIFLLAAAMLLSTACSKSAKKVNGEAAPTPAPRKAVEAFGIVEVNEIRNINLDFDTVVEEVPVKEGQRVKKGDVLVVLDMKGYMEQIGRKVNELNIARLEAEGQLKDGEDPDIKKLVNDLNYANDALSKALSEQETKKKLLESGAISRYEYDEFLRGIDEKRKNAEDIKYSMDILMHEKKQGIAIQNQKAESIESEISQMKDKLKRSYISGNNIVSDTDNGIVFEIGYKPGDMVSPTKKVLSIMNLDTMVVKADVAEEFIKDVKMGANAEILPIADKSKQYRGKVINISNRAVVKNGETVVPVEISIDNKDDFLLLNFNVDVEIYME